MEGREEEGPIQPFRQYSTTRAGKKQRPYRSGHSRAKRRWTSMIVSPIVSMFNISVLVAKCVSTKSTIHYLIAGPCTGTLITNNPTSALAPRSHSYGLSHTTLPSTTAISVLYCSQSSKIDHIWPGVRSGSTHAVWQSPAIQRPCHPGCRRGCPVRAAGEVLEFGDGELVVDPAVGEVEVVGVAV